MAKRSEGTYSILEIYRMRSGGYMWRLKDGHNGEKIAKASQARGFKTARSCFENAVGVTIRFAGGRGMLLPAKCPKVGDASFRVVGDQSLRVRRIS